MVAVVKTGVLRRNFMCRTYYCSRLQVYDNLYRWYHRKGEGVRWRIHGDVAIYLDENMQPPLFYPSTPRSLNATKCLPF